MPIVVRVVKILEVPVRRRFYEVGKQKQYQMKLKEVVFSLCFPGVALWDYSDDLCCVTNSCKSRGVEVQAFPDVMDSGEARIRQSIPGGWLVLFPDTQSLNWEDLESSEWSSWLGLDITWNLYSYVWSLNGGDLKAELSWDHLLGMSVQLVWGHSLVFWDRDCSKRELLERNTQKPRGNSLM